MRTTRKQFPVNWLTSGRLAFTIQRASVRVSFFHLLTPPRFGALNLPEVNQFTGNCFRMVRIVLKITFLGLRYPKGVTGSVPLCPIMALDQTYSLNIAQGLQGAPGFCTKEQVKRFYHGFPEIVVTTTMMCFLHGCKPILVCTQGESRL